MSGMTDAQLVTVRSRIGAAVPPTDDDLNALYDELHSTDKVVLAIIEPRLANMLAKPAKYTIDQDSAFDYSANIAALQKQVTTLQGQTAETGYLTLGRLERKWER